MDYALRLDAISKKYESLKGKNCFHEDFWALRDITFTLEKSRIIGIVGRNGAGKTTLLNIIAGVLSPTQGNITRKQGKVRGLFNLGIGFQDELTGRENIFLNGSLLGASRKEIEEQLSKIIDFSEIGRFIDMPLGSYSQGMRLRLGFSIVTHLDFDILAIDEVLAVGDALFQSKCYERLMGFKRMGKTLIITSQDMAMIERLCDEALLLDHGQILFQGAPKETIDRYRILQNTESFFVGPASQNTALWIKETKTWADNTTDWEKKFGTKEIVIESVQFQSGNKKDCCCLRSGDPLTIKVFFNAKNEVKNPHFGVAIFRHDGVYCYGPNTKFDNMPIPILKKGRGSFSLSYPRVMLAAGDYRVSVAVWDQEETLPFDHHYGCYAFKIGDTDQVSKALLKMPVYVKKDLGEQILSLRNIFGKTHFLNPELFRKEINSQEKRISVQLQDGWGVQKETLITNDRAVFLIRFQGDKPFKTKTHLWLGLYREDGVYCQGVVKPFVHESLLRVVFPQLRLLPGKYFVSLGIVSIAEQKFLVYDQCAFKFHTMFNKQDHGTIYLPHQWRFTV